MSHLSSTSALASWDELIHVLSATPENIVKSTSVFATSIELSTHHRNSSSKSLTRSCLNSQRSVMSALSFMVKAALLPDTLARQLPPSYNITTLAEAIFLRHLNLRGNTDDEKERESKDTNTPLTLSARLLCIISIL